MATKKETSKTPARKDAQAKSKPAAKPKKGRAKRIAKAADRAIGRGSAASKIRRKAADRAIGRGSAASKIRRKAAASKKTPVWKITPDQQIIGATLLGKILHYYSGIHVVTLVLEAPLTVGDAIRIKGHTTDLAQKVDSIQVEHQAVQSASIGEGVAIQIADQARVGDAVYKV